MAVICDFCPHRDDTGKFDLSKAKLAKFMVKLGGAHPTDNKAGCEEHLEQALYEVAPDGALKFWTPLDIMAVNDDDAGSAPSD